MIVETEIIVSNISTNLIKAYYQDSANTLTSADIFCTFADIIPAGFLR